MDNVGGFFFFSTAIINLFITFFAQNYILRKDYLCCKNVGFLLLHKVVVVVGYAVSCIGYRVIEEPKQFLTTLGLHVGLAALLILCYFVFGFYMYRHTTPRVLLIGSIAGYLSLSVAIFYDEANRQYNPETSDTFYVVYQVILFGFISFFCFSVLQSMKRNGIDRKSKNFKKKVFFVFNILESAS